MHIANSSNSIKSRYFLPGSFLLLLPCDPRSCGCWVPSLWRNLRKPHFESDGPVVKKSKKRGYWRFCKLMLLGSEEDLILIIGVRWVCIASILLFGNFHGTIERERERGCRFSNCWGVSFFEGVIDTSKARKEVKRFWTKYFGLEKRTKMILVAMDNRIQRKLSQEWKWILLILFVC